MGELLKRWDESRQQWVPVASLGRIEVIRGGWSLLSVTVSSVYFSANTRVKGLVGAVEVKGFAYFYFPLGAKITGFVAEP